MTCKRHVAGPLSDPAGWVWRIALGALFLVLLNVVISMHARGMLVPQDWWMWEQLPRRIASGTVYDHGLHYDWVWSPIAALLFAWVIVPLGYTVWFGLHLAVLPFLRRWWMIVASLASLPFWIDAVMGNAMVFVVVAGVMATQGSRIGAFASIALFALMPRPVQLPLLAWILWSRPSSRLSFVGMTVLTVIVTLLTGWDWPGALVSQAAAMDDGANLAPTRFLGPAWLIVGVPLAAWLASRGWLGLAGLSMSPYLFPQYFLMVLVYRRYAFAPLCRTSPSRRDGRPA
jgi:hypothetical protein